MSIQQEILSELQEFENFDEQADGWVYGLTILREVDEKQFYYVGKVNGGGAKDLIHRIRSHRLGSSNITGPAPSEHGDMLINPIRAEKESLNSEVFKATEIVRIRSVWKGDGELLASFDARLKEVERNTAYSVALEKETTRVLGVK